jgi:hypothetical protein
MTDMAHLLPDVSDDDPPFIPRPELGPFIKQRFGFSVNKARIDKDRMSGVLPQPDAYHGRFELFKPSTARLYAERLLSMKSRKLVGSRSGRLDEAVT